MTHYTLASLDGLTEGIGSLLFGLLRPVCWLLLAWMSYKATQLSTASKYLMVGGSLGNFTAAVVFLFVNATFEVPAFWSDYAQLVATPATVAFTLGFFHAAVRLGGLQVGQK
jgi:uncharacterized membrane protein YGL010W